ncbi:uncharacterized protein LOC142193748 [Leptodactylus fuscus]|uniref:uncharacterized protein LOC142193748 n=1 Tax=Leptodactylus fuscus TaxID=238119 RepID=UPI003F4E7F25
MIIEAFTKKPYCVPEIVFKMSLKYLFMIKGNSPKEVLLEQELNDPSMTSKTLGYKGEYCVAAQTKFLAKESKFSHPVCINFTQNDGQYHTVLSAVLPASLISGTIAFIILLILYISPVKSKIPEALDFPNNKYCQKDHCLPEPYSNIYDSVTIYNIAEQDSTRDSLLPTKYGGSNIYPVSGRGYMVRPAMQASGSHNQESYSSKGSAFNSSSDQSSSGCTCPNISGSDSDMLLKSMNDHTNNCLEESNIDISENLQMCSSTSISVTHLLDSNPMLGPNLLVNIPIDTLCIGDNNTHIDIADGESDNQYFTDSDESLDSLSTDYKMSDHSHTLQEEETCKDWNSGYTQRTCMARN